MFKSWRKSKIKTVFLLKFQATQVPKLKKNKSNLTISLIPEDVGKPTVRLEKAPVQDGTCSWENPIYETVKFVREPKTGKLHEKIYFFVVSTGSSKSGYLGEAWIDFTDFVAETEPLTISLPLTTSNCGVVLHVTIQKMQGAADQRDIEENGTSTICQEISFNNQPSVCHTEGNDYYNFTQDGHGNETTSQKNEQYGSFRAATGSSYTLQSCRDINSDHSTKQDHEFKKDTIHQDPASFLSPLRQNSMPQKGSVEAITTKNQMHQRSNTDWSVGSASDGSLVDSTNSPEDNLPRERLHEASDNSIEKLRSEVSHLTRQAELSELELQTLRKQIVKETKRGQNLSVQITGLKEERDAIRIECERLTSLQKYSDDVEVSNQLQSENEESRILLEEIREELNYEKDLNNNLRLQLLKTQDSNSELILAVRDLNEMLEEEKREISCLSRERETSKNAEEGLEKYSKYNTTKDGNQLAFKQFVEKHDDTKEVELLKREITDLYSEIEVYKKQREELEMHLEQLIKETDVLKQENHDISTKLEQNQLQAQVTQNNYSKSLATIKELESQVERLEENIKKQSHEFSESLVSINELESQVKRLKKELEKQAQGFEDDLDAMTRAKVEQEQRAIRAEEALRKTRWKNVVTAERLQEEFQRLSMEMASKFDENQKLATEALIEANELRLQKITLEEKLQKANEELGLIRDRNEVELQEFSNQIDLKERQIKQMSIEMDNKSKQLECAQKHERGKHEALSMEIQMLRDEIGRLTRDNFSGQAEQTVKLKDETEHLKTSCGEAEMEMQQLNKEKDDLECNITELLAEVTLVKERNKSMERELKEMQERYSEMSLKFAEVEGERQKLVMAIRNLKNDKKS